MKDNPIGIFNESDLELDLVMHHSTAMLARELIVDDLKVELGWINVVIMSSKEHTDLNIKYLDHDYATDILTFEFPEEDVVNGEIYINSEVLVANSEEYDVAVVNELNRLIIHGLLHLSGLNDHTEEDQVLMTMNEDKYLKEIERKGFM